MGVEESLKIFKYDINDIVYFDAKKWIIMDRGFSAWAGTLGAPLYTIQLMREIDPKSYPITMTVYEDEFNLDVINKIKRICYPIKKNKRKVTKSDIKKLLA